MDRLCRDIIVFHLKDDHSGECGSQYDINATWVSGVNLQDQKYQGEGGWPLDPVFSVQDKLDVYPNYCQHENVIETVEVESVVPMSIC